MFPLFVVAFLHKCKLYDVNDFYKDLIDYRGVDFNENITLKIVITYNKKCRRTSEPNKIITYLDDETFNNILPLMRNERISRNIAILKREKLK